MLFADSDHFRGLCGVQSQRFFAEHVFSCLCRGHCSAQMFTLGCGQVDRVHLRISETHGQLFCSVPCFDSVFATELCSLAHVAAHQCHKLRVLCTAECRQH